MLTLAPQRRADGLLTAAEAFIFGAVGRAVATIITFPGQRANVMAKAGGGDNSKGLVSMLLEVYRKDGIGPLYSGMQVGGHPREPHTALLAALTHAACVWCAQPEITRGVLSAAIMM